MSNSLSAQHISTNLANYEAARTGFFSLIVDDIDNIVKASYSGVHADAADSDKIARAQEVLKLNVIKAPVPHFSLEVMKYKRGNDTVTFAGTPSYESGNIVVDDVVGMDTKSILMAWQGLAYNVHTRKGGRMKDYKFLALHHGIKFEVHGFAAREICRHAIDARIGGGKGEVGRVGAGKIDGVQPEGPRAAVVDIDGMLACGEIRVSERCLMEMRSV